MGVDVCYTNHVDATSDDMDSLLHLLGAANTSFVITVPGSDDVMLGYQSLAHHDVAMLRRTMGLRPTPEFERWLERVGVTRGGMLGDDVPDLAGAIGAGRATLAGSANAELKGA